MNRTELHPIEVAILAAVVVIEAAAVLIVALVAVVLAVARWRPAASQAEVLCPSGPGRESLPLPSSPRQVRPLLDQLDTHPIPPSLHPLALLAERLESLPVTRLRPMAGTRSKRARKAELIALVAACC